MGRGCVSYVYAHLGLLFCLQKTRSGLGALEQKNKIFLTREDRDKHRAKRKKRGSLSIQSSPLDRGIRTAFVVVPIRAIAPPRLLQRSHLQHQRLLESLRQKTGDDP